MSTGSTQQHHDWSALRRKLLVDDGKLFLPAGWKLPVLPKVVTQFLDLANQPGCDLKKLSKLLEQDPNLTCELLRHVNSAAIGLRHKATSAHQALVNLGLRRSKMLLLTAAIQSSIKKFNTHLFDLHQFWADNLERALFAREIAGELGADVDLAYTGAMLQDFLLPVLGHMHLQTYVAFWGERKGIPSDLTEYELQKFNVHHAQVAAACLLQWNVPDELVCSVLCHHLSFTQLQELGMTGTHLHAVAASALIPGRVAQLQNIAVALTEWAAHDVSFDLCDIAERVDACFLHEEQTSSDREPLLNRIESCLASQLQLVVDNEQLLHRQLGNFILESLIGEGAMGTVYRARHTMLDRPAAVKVLSNQELSSLEIARFEREVQHSSRLTHPNTISIYDFGRTHDGMFFYAMEYVEGLSLKQLVQLHGPLPEGRVIHILRQICGSLQEAHELGLVHRDIKPENIVISVKGMQGDFITVLDFGLVLDLSDETNQECTLSGTPLYMAPESIHQPGHSTPACDIYAIGAVGYYLTCGQPLYTGNDALDICLKQVSELPPTPSQRLKEPIASDLEQLIMSCLQKSPEKRPASAEALSESLAKCINVHDWNSQLGLRWWRENGQPRPHEGHESGFTRADATIIVGNESTLQ